MNDDLAQIQAAINSATYRIDEIEKAAATPIGELKTDQQALLNKLKALEVALNENGNSLRDDLIKRSHRVTNLENEFTREIKKIKILTNEIEAIKNNLDLLQTAFNDLAQGLQMQIKNIVTKEFIAELYKKGGE